MADQKPRRRRKLGEKAVRDALVKAGGNAAEAARALGVSRSGVWHYIDTRPEIQEIVSEFRGELVDHAEAALFAAVKNGDGWAIRFALTQTKEGRARGYGPAQADETTGEPAVKRVPDRPTSSRQSMVAAYLESIGAGRPQDFDESQAA